MAEMRHGALYKIQAKNDTILHVMIYENSKFGVGRKEEMFTYIKLIIRISWMKSKQKIFLFIYVTKWSKNVLQFSCLQTDLSFFLSEMALHILNGYLLLIILHFSILFHCVQTWIWLILKRLDKKQKSIQLMMILFHY